MPATVLLMFSCRLLSFTSLPMVPSPSSIFFAMLLTEFMVLVTPGPASWATLFTVSMACWRLNEAVRRLSMPSLRLPLFSSIMPLRLSVVRTSESFRFLMATRSPLVMAGPSSFRRAVKELRFLITFSNCSSFLATILLSRKVRSSMFLTMLLTVCSPSSPPRTLLRDSVIFLTSSDTSVMVRISLSMSA